MAEAEQYLRNILSHEGIGKGERNLDKIVATYMKRIEKSAREALNLLPKPPIGIQDIGPKMLAITGFSKSINKNGGIDPSMLDIHPGTAVLPLLLDPDLLRHFSRLTIQEQSSPNDELTSKLQTAGLKSAKSSNQTIDLIYDLDQTPIRDYDIVRADLRAVTENNKVAGMIHSARRHVTNNGLFIVTIPSGINTFGSEQFIMNCFPIECGASNLIDTTQTTNSFSAVFSAQNK